MPHVPGKFVWFEHLSNDPAAASAFYQALFGWKISSTPVAGLAYELIQLRAGEAIGGIRAAAPGVRSQWTSYLSVDDVDRSFAAALQAGASGLLPPTPFGPMGRGAGVLDPTGASLCLWKGAFGDRADQDLVPIGDWYWNELCTPDPDMAAAFYERVFGLTTQRVSNSLTPEYRFLMKDGRARGGIYGLSGSGRTPRWLPYVRVEDCEAAASRAQRLGARCLVPATDIPEIGRFAALSDPLGVPFAVIRSLGVRLSAEEAESDADPGGAF